MKNNVYLIREESDYKIYYSSDLIKFYYVKNENAKEFDDYISANQTILDDKNDVEEKYNNRLKQLTIGVADGCNLKCRYCYANQGTYNKKFCLMPYEKMRDLYDEVCSKYKEGIESICFFGGEPMLDFKNIKKFVLYVNNTCREKDIKPTNFYIITNGTLITQEDWDFMVENKFKITISLDGDKNINDENRIFKSEKGSVYQKIHDLMIRNKKNDMFVFAEATLTPSFFEKYTGDIESYVKPFLELKFDGFFPFVAEGENYNYFDNNLYKKVELFYNDLCNYWLNSLTDKTNENYQKIPFTLLNTLNLLTSGNKSSLCGAGRNTVYYGMNGKFYKCQMYYSKDISINLNELENKTSHKPTFAVCEKCISKNTCTFWCEGGSLEFADSSSVSKIRCVVQNILTLTICKWLCSLDNANMSIAVERLKNIKIKMVSCL